MIDPINAVREKLIIAETSEPMTDGQKTPAAKLYREALDALTAVKRRNSELLTTNIDYELRARKSEGYLITLLLAAHDVDAELRTEIEAYLAEGPWNITA